ncbi:AAA family ATPase [Qipengyuania sp. 483]
MLSKAVVKNVGVLRAFSTPNQPTFDKLTLLYGRNGRGKTTFSSILRSASCGDCDLVIGRKTLGNGGAKPEVILLFNDGSRNKFTDGDWESESNIEVFDRSFITDNLFAGEAIDLDHDRKLFTVILGKAGVKLAKQLEWFKEAAKRRAATLKAATAAVEADVPSGMSLEEFLGSVPPLDIDDQIEAAKLDGNAARQSSRLQSLQLPSALPIPTLSDDIPQKTALTVEGIQAESRERLAEHFTKHKLGKDGEEWVRFGLQHIADEACPFCARDNVDAEGMVGLYEKIFGEQYQAHLSDLRAIVGATEAAIGVERQAALGKAVAENETRIKEWSDFCDFKDIILANPTAALDAMKTAHEMLSPVLNAKLKSPLETIDSKTVFADAKGQVAKAIEVLTEYNAAINSVVERAEAKRSGPKKTEDECKAKVEQLQKRKRRGDDDVQHRIDVRFRALRADERARKIRSLVQDRLKAANTASATHYHDRVNHYLEKFSASFAISKISNAMTGNSGSVDYGLIVRGHPIKRGRRDASEAVPTFKNTLSSGDKTTLAFAFFLAGLDRETDLASRIVVFDDPLSSQDTHRQKRTVHYLGKLCDKCAQVIVLSHDAYFLRRIKKRFKATPCAAYQVRLQGPEQWASIDEADLDVICRDSHAIDVEKLRSYLANKQGEPLDVTRAVRTVLETHYRRTFPVHFQRDDYLGSIVKKIRDGGSAHPCALQLEDLEHCNDSTSEDHHGDDPMVATLSPPDPDDLHSIVQDALRLINAI